MKKLILSIAILMAAASLQSFQLPVFGQQSATITYLGTKGNDIVFELKLENNTGKRSALLIKDKSGETVYEETIFEKQLVKRFILPADETNEFVFVVSNGTNKYEKRFKVDRVQTTSIAVNEVK